MDQRSNNNLLTLVNYVRRYFGHSSGQRFTVDNDITYRHFHHFDLKALARGRVVRDECLAIELNVAHQLSNLNYSETVSVVFDNSGVTIHGQLQSRWLLFSAIEMKKVPRCLFEGSPLMTIRFHFSRCFALNKLHNHMSQFFDRLFIFFKVIR